MCSKARADRWTTDSVLHLLLFDTVSPLPSATADLFPSLASYTKIAYVGYEHVDHTTVTDAIAGQTLFIHGKNVDEGSNKSVEETDEAHNAAAAAAVAKEEEDEAEEEEEDEEDEEEDEEAEVGTDVSVDATVQRHLQNDPHRPQLSDSEQESARIARKLQKWSAKYTDEEDADATRQLQSDPYRRRMSESEKESARVARKLQKWSAKYTDEEQPG